MSDNLWKSDFFCLGKKNGDVKCNFPQPVGEIFYFSNENKKTSLKPKLLEKYVKQLSWCWWGIKNIGQNDDFCKNRPYIFFQGLRISVSFGSMLSWPELGTSWNIEDINEEPEQKLEKCDTKEIPTESELHEEEK